MNLPGFSLGISSSFIPGFSPGIPPEILSLITIGISLRISPGNLCKVFYVLFHQGYLQDFSKVFSQNFFIDTFRAFVIHFYRVSFRDFSLIPSIISDLIPLGISLGISLINFFRISVDFPSLISPEILLRIYFGIFSCDFFSDFPRDIFPSEIFL